MNGILPFALALAWASAALGDLPPITPPTSSPVKPITVLGPPCDAPPPIRVAILTHEALPAPEVPTGIRKLFDGMEGYEPVEVSLATIGEADLRARLRACQAIVLWSEPFLTSEVPTLPTGVEPILLSAVREGVGLVVADRAWWMVWNMPDLRAALQGQKLDAVAIAPQKPAAPQLPLDGLDSGLLALKVEERFHPAASPMNSPWLLTGNVVSLGPRESSESVRVLLRVDATNMDIATLNLPRPEAAQQAVAWALRLGEGAVVCSGIGGGEDTADDDYYREHLRGAIRWCAGAVDAAPAPPRFPHPKYETLADGLQVFDVKVGEGALPAQQYKVTLHLRAELPDGRLLRDTRHGGNPIPFTIGMFEVMEGLEAAVLSMKPGGRRIVLVPPDLQGRADFPGFVIPRNTLIRLDIELISTR